MFPVGTTITISPAQVSGFPVPSVQFRWLRDGEEIPGADVTSYAVTLVDVGASLSVRQTASNPIGSVSVVSNSVQIDTVELVGLPIMFDGRNLTFDNQNLELR
jgi:hypothetical protein